MLDFFFALSATVVMIFMVLQIYYTRRRKMCRKGSYERYIASTMVLTMIVGVLVSSFVQGVLVQLTYQNQFGPRALLTMMASAVFAMALYGLSQELENDEDNWFSRMRKKLKDGITNLVTHLSPKPAMATIPIN